MNLRSLGIIYRKELTDLLRDKRTIMAMIVIPVLVMPLLSLGLGTAAVKVIGAARKEVPDVMIIGGDDSPKTVALLHDDKQLNFVLYDANYAKMISDKTIRAAVKIPAGFDASLQSGNALTIQIYDYEGDFKSSFATDEIKSVFDNLSDKTVDERLKANNFPKKLLTPFDVEQTNVAPPEKVSGNLIGMIIPYIVIFMCLTGSIYPAIDLTAGEKERGTLETLLCSPVSRLAIVLGKCLMVLTVALSTVVLSLSSTGVSLYLAKNMAGRDFPELTINPASLAAVFVMMLPIALFFASFMLCIGLFSRSVKEANSYLQPLMILVIVPTMAGMLPGMELNYEFALVPILNVSLVCKEILSGTYHWNFIALIFVSMSVYASLALALAVAMFKRESVLFRT